MSKVFNVSTNFEHEVYNFSGLVGSAMVTVEVVVDHAPLIVSKHSCVHVKDVTITSASPSVVTVLCNLVGGTRFRFDMRYQATESSIGWVPIRPIDEIYRSYLAAANAGISEAKAEEAAR